LKIKRRSLAKSAKNAKEDKNKKRNRVRREDPLRIAIFSTVSFSR